MGRIIFVPIGIVGGPIAGQISKKIFDFIWSRISEEENLSPSTARSPGHSCSRPSPTEGAIFRLAKGLVDRGARTGYMRLTGSWPGKERPETT